MEFIMCDISDKANIVKLKAKLDSQVTDPRANSPLTA